MPMLAPWSDHEQPDGSIQVRFNDQHRFTLNWVQERGQWELRRTGQDEVIETDEEGVEAEAPDNEDAAGAEEAPQE